MVSIEDYKGREQSYVKHVLLEEYLEALVHKTASSYSHIVYTDGFAGPWQSAKEDFNDTSFGIALGALRRAKASWKKAGRDVTMSAFLVERNPAAFKQLETLPPKFPDIRIKPLKGDFIELIPTILKDIPKDAFAFFLLDPKGWRIPLQKIEPLLVRDNSEVVFNFMLEFINRAASINDPIVVAGLDELLPFGDWRDKLLEAQTSDERKVILTKAFSDCLFKLGHYKYVCETTILRPSRDRPLYSLFYGTRHDTGLEVFRDCQVKALEAQSKTRAATKVHLTENKTGQSELFRSLHEMSPEDDVTPFLAAERQRARETMIALAPARASPMLYKDLWPLVLSRHVVRKPDVNKIGADLKKEGTLVFPNWETGKRVPHPGYTVYRASAADE
ncbi:three-Cys-motif partner protein TcmP [Bradyrhizobium manausense]|uniref:three-Cys-motif partner protein TcmP n=1 Tax=Bradyrhizobium manausense TaxID=989370 RepID=UPI001BACB3D4|nr:three-Cys-motif partner protein TcmP [Bradyrhizobium manausense]MBR1090795.1 three-Cys-motif partner protein TcmP [Bradyrhizobium manausense]